MSSRRFGSQLWKAFSAAASGPACHSTEQAVASLRLFSAHPLASAVAAAPSTSALSAIRAFTSSRGSLMSAELGTILKSEIEHETSSYVKPDQITSGPPAPFVLSEAPGDTMLTLSRKMKDNETVSVDLHVNNQPGQDEEDGAELPTTIVFNVTVTKGEQSLVFECESDGEFVAINHVSHEPKDAENLAESTYTGPVFEELDENLQRQFRVYLEERGITHEFGEYLRHLVHDKEQREYTLWLKKVATFISSS